MRRRIMWFSVMVLLAAVVINIVCTIPDYPDTSANRLILHQVAGEIASYAMEKNTAQIRMAEVYGGRDLPVDYWGEPIWFTISKENDGEYIWAVSAGQDRKKGTEDDMAVKYDFDLSVIRQAVGVDRSKKMEQGRTDSTGRDRGTDGSEH